MESPEQMARLEEVLVDQLDEDSALAVYGAAEEKRQGIDQMMWQVPALGLTAQAFLLTIALSPDTSGLGRALAAGLGLLAALAGIQLLLKHRYHELMLSKWLERYAERREWPSAHNPDRVEAFAYEGRGHPWRRRPSSPPRRLRERLVDRRSPHVWLGALSFFAAVDLLVLILLFFGAEPLR